MKRGILSRLAMTLGFGLGGVPDMPKPISLPSHREPTKKEKRSGSKRIDWARMEPDGLM